MDLGLKGRHALVTGASKGIGRAIAIELANEGVNVAVTGRNVEELESLRDELQKKVKVKVIAVDLAVNQSEVVARLAKECAETDILVNNAGAAPLGRLTEVDEKTWREAWELKVFGYINLSRAFYSLMEKRKRGVIINIMGNSAERSEARYICGGTANAVLNAFTKALGGQSHKEGIRVVGINPGPVLTPRLKNGLAKVAKERFGSEDKIGEITKHQPFGRPATVEEVSGMVAFLASDRSSYTSGTVVNIDGGIAHSGGGFVD